MDEGEVINYVTIEISIKDLILIEEYDFMLKVSTLLKQINGDVWDFEEDDCIGCISIFVDDVSPCKQKVILKVRGNLYNLETEAIYRFRHGRMERVID